VRAAGEAGATVIFWLVARAGLLTGALVELPFAFPPRRFIAISHGDRHRSRAAAVLLELIRGGTGGLTGRSAVGLQHTR
jgi:hypothetical protein